ncbi:gap junction Cx32.2 protein-like [Sardina pilchardus]|uniref:gap junction Cx32.2 protein-like n=1 Tax=Sardina pilchardus TaxID=27697 RepID=UPI002E121F21
MGDFGFLSKLLDKVAMHSTVVGKVWMSVLFLFRIMVLGAGVESVWGDEHSNLVCDSTRKGCENVCYDLWFPISHVRFWVLQIIFVSTPTLLYLGHAVHVIHREKKLHEQAKNATSDCVPLKRPKYTDERGRVQIRGVLLRSYLAQLFFKILLEAAFIVGQYYLYGFFMTPMFKCKRYPCANTGTVECFMSRPTEKTIFIIFQLVVACVSLLLTILEVFYLVCKQLKRKNRAVDQPSTSIPLTYQPRLDMVDALKQNKANMSYNGEKSL